VKERHEILTRFRSGSYKILVTSHVLNEGVDVPEARIAIILSGTGSMREFVQRLGRVLRKGRDANKLAVLYEVVAEDTSDEKTADRRRGDTETPRQLSLVYSHERKTQARLKAAESSIEWRSPDSDNDPNVDF
jgi:superfamily II DNA or RNA helicase